MKMYELFFIYEIRVNNVQKEGTSPLTSTSNLLINRKASPAPLTPQSQPVL